MVLKSIKSGNTCNPPLTYAISPKMSNWTSYWIKCSWRPTLNSSLGLFQGTLKNWIPESLDYTLDCVGTLVTWLWQALGETRPIYLLPTTPRGITYIYIYLRWVRWDYKALLRMYYCLLAPLGLLISRAFPGGKCFWWLASLEPDSMIDRDRARR